MTTINREDALKVVQEILDFLDEPMEKGTARLILKLIELIPDSGSYTREQVVPLSVITEKLEDIKKYYIDTLTYPLSHAKTKHLPLAGRKLEDFIKMELPGLASLPAHGDGDSFLLHLIDVVWSDAFEDSSVPSTTHAKTLLDKARNTFTPSPPKQ